MGEIVIEKVLILGASGLVGRALIDECKDGFDLYGTYSTSFTNLPNHKQFQLEVQQIDKLREMIRSIKPDIVISCIRGDFAHQLKFHKELAIELRNSSSRLYFFSTTNVFDGDFSKPHTETDIPISESDYGNFKIDCEHMLLDRLEDQAVIIRIPAIWGSHSPRWNLIKESISNNKIIDVYSNLVRSNLLDVQLAKQLRFIIKNKLKGIFHLSTTDLMTEAHFYDEIIRTLAREKSILRYSFFQDNEETRYFALISTRDDMPGSLQSTNKDIISLLLR
ncbi:sugar nucleotide-binding protein [Neobacillus sp. OS1-2]|uniref:sugar nucleotide-binding protein n=1 Tax=Neobacillus sp. OS1-2 TaxID=3070680 RepID=UPI0027DF1DF5|nr:sugar nucleotide-binding protein [Neobacillus sp. OS1-2]WML39701.1 sugar nucleotide-binding protein [Neobacillus sp. OS1-2]